MVGQSRSGLDRNAQRLTLAENDMNLPNSMTILRVFFVPLLVVVLFTRQLDWEIGRLPIIIGREFIATGLRNIK
jgi:phosphatidylglycerophosphate synthase